MQDQIQDGTHVFIFDSEKDVRETLLVEREDVNPLDVIEDVTSGLISAGMALEELIHEHDFTFVCFRKDGMRAAFTVGVSESQVSVPIVVIGGNRGAVGNLAGAIKSNFPS